MVHFDVVLELCSIHERGLSILNVIFLSSVQNLETLTETNKRWVLDILLNLLPAFQKMFII